MSAWVGVLAGGVAFTATAMTFTWRISAMVASVLTWSLTIESVTAMLFLAAYWRSSASLTNWVRASE